ncbi:hypothetical protein HIM_03343 [Hirsutella minnesotensis 3608]|uniref:GED domain-containing protein n=1 Tax=Hirsutella minnesotensis 3608 TaxID=1043627 RepID=A0A0F8A2H7_9HYPO|nr:hypothetical protein HIM_03343 [Hirsutella minnesotensis 3608]
MTSVNLQSTAHSDLLDIIDKLRAQGISKYVALPEIVVTGDQSAGKSSVLEAISGMSFPTKDNLCTRFATELILRRSSNADMKVSIIPDADRPEHEQDALKLFAPSVDLNNPRLGELVEGAKEAMGLNGPKRVFSNDILRVEMSGPEQPHLTLVDLPGLFQAGNSAQSDEDAELVTQMVTRYMKLTRLARELDPTGVRTLGLVTKPDTLDQGSDSETAYINLAQNKDVKFRLGWHVLKNRDYQMRNTSSAERDEAEVDFFSRGPWNQLERSHLGVAPLKPRLSTLLKDQIMMQMPSVLGEISDGIASCTERLEKLGAPRGSISEQRRYLLHTSQSFSRLLRAAVDGNYSDKFFLAANTDEGYHRRLRAVVQNTLTEFRDQMSQHGHSRYIVEEGDKDRHSLASNEVMRSDYVQEVRTLMRRSRGCELPGTFNPLVVGELFLEQSQPWSAIASMLKKNIMKAVWDTCQAALRHVAAEETVELLLQFVSSDIQGLGRELDTAFEQIMEPYSSLHPITYNHYLTSNVQSAQKTRRRREMKARVRGLRHSESPGWGAQIKIWESELLDLLTEHIENDMELYGSSLAVDFMEAYYKVAMKTFVDSISTLAIECRLLQRLPRVFDSDKIHDMEDGDISRLAVDSEINARERALQTEKLAVLETAMGELMRLDRFRSTVQDGGRDISWKIPQTLGHIAWLGRNRVEDDEYERLANAGLDGGRDISWKIPQTTTEEQSQKHPVENEVNEDVRVDVAPETSNSIFTS